MANTIEFTQSLIESSNRRREISAKMHLNEGCGARKRKVAKEAEEVKEEKKLNEASELEDKVDDVIEDTVEDKVEDIIEDKVDDAAGTEVAEGAEDIEETIDDVVYFCNKCHKHFIATPDVPSEVVKCPICETDEMLINMGTAAEHLDDKQNEEAVEEIKDEAPEDLEPKDEEPVAEEGEMSFDVDNLGESLETLARKHINEQATVKILSAKAVDGNIVVEGVCLPDKKSFNMTLSGVDELKEGKGVLNGTSDMLKNCKVRIGCIKEGNKISVNRMGYGFLNESKKIVGVIGE